MAVIQKAWDQSKLRSLKKLNPDLLIQIQNTLGRDLTEKLKKGNAEKDKDLN